jgi:predicted transcriptional regulator of viral defense system
MEAFLYENPVFSVRALVDSEAGVSKQALYKRLRYLEQTGRVASVVRGVYAVVPPGQMADTIQPDPFLVLQALRPDVVFCGHSALDLQGVAHSVWNVVSAYSKGSPNSFSHGGVTYRTISWPEILLAPHRFQTLVDRRGKILSVTGPELTLLEGFEYPHRVGGIEELVRSADSFRKLDGGVLLDLLERVDERKLYAAVGWFLSRDAGKWKIEPRFLEELRRRGPKTTVYLERGADRSVLVNDWKLMVPRDLVLTEGVADRDAF